MPNPTVTIYHPKLGETTCSESAVRIHERNGWSRKAPKKSEAAKATPAKKAASPAANTPNPTDGPTAGEES